VKSSTKFWRIFERTSSSVGRNGMLAGQMRINAAIDEWGERLEKVKRSGVLTDKELFWLILGRNVDSLRIRSREYDGLLRSGNTGQDLPATIGTTPDKTRS
jgi:hypothetical protein